MTDLFRAAGQDPFDHLRRANLVLLALLPAALLLSRGVAEVIVAIIGLSFLMATVARRQWANLAEPAVVILIVTWVVLNLVISPLALKPETSFARSLPWLRFIVFFAATAMWLLRSPEDLKIVLIVWSVTLALAMLDGYVQLVTGRSLSGHPIMGNRLSGPLVRPNIGMFVARIGFPLLAVALILSASRARVTEKFLGLVLFTAIAFAFVLLSGERTAAILTTLALLCGTAVVIIFMPRQRLWGCLAALAVPASLLLLFFLNGTVRTRFAEFCTVIGNFWSSIYGEIFTAASRLWELYPITGVGLKGFQDACRANLPELAKACHQHAHNIYLEWLSETGLVGFACFLAFVAAIVTPVVRLAFVRTDQRLVAAALLGGLIVTLFPLAATQSFFSNWPAMVMWAALAVIFATTRIALGAPAPYVAARGGS